MVRAGDDNELIDPFVARQAVGVGWGEVPDLGMAEDWESLLEVVRTALPDRSVRSTGIVAGQLHRLRVEMAPGDLVLSFRKETREYLVGTIRSSYAYDAELFGPTYPHVRRVAWEARRLPRDRLPREVRNSLGSTLTVFNITPHLAAIRAAVDPSKGIPDAVEATVAAEPPYDEEVAKTSRELITDILARVDPYDFQDLVAAVLRAMGYKTRVSPRGSDRGIDIRASPDALLLGDPAVRVQVKHRESSATGPEIQQFESAIGANGRGLFVSTGGFSKDAKMHADRAHRPMTLVDDEQFIDLLTGHYERLEPEFQRMVPLRKIWVPVKE